MIDLPKNLRVDYPADYQLVKLAGDASTREYYRLKGKNQSYIYCLFDEKTKKQIEAQVELTSVFLDNNILTPALTQWDLSQGFILQEDLGDQTLFEVSNVKKSREYYLMVLDSLIKINTIDIGKYSESPFANLFFDIEKLMYEVDFSIKYFISGYLSIVDKNLLDTLRNEFEKIVLQIQSIPRVLCHRDFHSRNIMINKNKVYIIDHQDARMGPLQYDLVSLLEDSYVSLELGFKEELKQKYFEHFRKKIKISRNEFNQQYSRVHIQRSFKAIGSFAYIDYSKSDSSYLKYIGPTLDNLINLYDKQSEFSGLMGALKEVQNVL